MGWSGAPDFVVKLKITTLEILEILEIQSFWFSFDPGNTGKPVMLIQFWSWKYWKTIHSNNLGTWNRFTLGVWTYTLGVWTYTRVFWVSELILCCVWTYTLLCLNLYFVVSELILCCVWTYTLLCLNLYFVVSVSEFPDDGDDGDGVPTTLPIW